MSRLLVWTPWSCRFGRLFRQATWIIHYYNENSRFYKHFLRHLLETNCIFRLITDEITKTTETTVYAGKNKIELNMCALMLLLHLRPSQNVRLTMQVFIFFKKVKIKDPNLIHSQNKQMITQHSENDWLFWCKNIFCLEISSIFILKNAPKNAKLF